MITRTRTVTVLDSSKLPFLLRTGKVQQNAQDRGEGQWQVPHGGFTSQLKYRQNAGRFEGELAGFTFCRYTPTDGIFNARGRAQLPHIWLMESEGAGQGEALVNGAGQDGATTGWSAGADTTASSVAVSNPHGFGGTAIKLRRSTSSGTGTVSISQSSVTTTGQPYAIEGAIYTTSGTLLSIKNGTETIWPNKRSQRGPDGAWSLVETPLMAFPGSSSGDSITIECTGLPESSGEYVLFALRITPVAFAVREIWLCGEGDGYFAGALDTLKARALARIQAATTSAEYEIENGDLVCTTAGFSAFVAGPVPWVCGWGFVPSNLASATNEGFSGAITTEGATSLACLSWANKPGAQMPFSQYRATRATPVADPEYAFESWTDYADEPYRMLDLDRLPHVALRNTQGTSTPEIGVLSNGNRVFRSYKKNHSEHRYYWQNNPDTSPKLGGWETLYNAISVPRLRYYARGGLYLQAGDVIKVAGAKMRVTAEQDSGLAVGARAINVEGKTLASSSVWTANVMHGAPQSIAWMVGWYDYFEANPSELPEGTTLSSIDPHPIRDVSRTRYHDPTKMIKEMLGDDQDVALPLACVCTTVCDLFARYDSDRALIDFAALSRLIKSADLKGAKYQIEAPEPSTEGEQPKESNILQMLTGLCQTHGIRMVWAYSDAQRSWRLTFRPDAAMTVAEAYLDSRVIDEHTALLEKPSEVIGGDYNYSGIKAKYKQLPESEVTIEVADPSGRVQHTGPRVLEIKDAMTILPSGRDGIDKLGTDFGNRALTLSFLSSRHKLATTIKSAGILRVGDSVAVDVAHLRNPKSGRQDGALLCAEINSVATDLGKNARCNVDMTLSRLALGGISPSLDVNTWTRSGSVVSVTGCATDPADNDYAPTDGGLTDLATFGCYSYDDDRGIYLRPCGCGAYACYIAERDPASKTWQDDVSIWACTVSDIDVAAGTCTVTLASGASAFPASTSGQYVLFFARRDSADLQPCQTAYYGWLGNDEEVVVDSGGAESAPATVG